MTALSRQAKGCLCLLASVFCNAAAYHCAAEALTGLPPLALATWAHLVAAAAAFFVLLVRPGPWRWPAPGRLLAVTLAGAVGTGLCFASVRGYGPETTAFLANGTLMWLMVASVIGGERLGAREAIAAAMLIAGSMALCVRESGPAWGALALMVPATAFTAAKQLGLARAGASGPEALLPTMAVSQLAMAAWAGALALALGQWRVLTPAHAPAVIAGGLLGNFAGMGLLYAAYALLGVSRAAPLDALRPVAVLTLGLLLGAISFGVWQWVGSGLVLIGSIGLLSQMRPSPRQS